LPTIATKYFGEVAYKEEDVVVFAEGPLGFAGERRFLLLQHGASSPLSFLQSLESPSLCFPAAPVRRVDPHFTLRLDETAHRSLGLSATESISDGSLLVLAIVTFGETEPPAANLLAPVVIHVPSRQAAQVVQFDSGYPIRRPVPAFEEVLSCW
jgi:flagellar assembly factor FliW